MYLGCKLTKGTKALTCSELSYLKKINDPCLDFDVYRKIDAHIHQKDLVRRDMTLSPLLS